MNKNKAEVIRFGSKTDFTGGETKAFSNSDYTLEFEPVQQITERILLGARTNSTIRCHDCKQDSRLDGYRFTLVPLCHCCRTERELQITRNRFERRQKR
jgi:hypothetical protein